MKTLQIFLDNLWPVFLSAAVILPLLQWGRRKSLDGNAAVFAGTEAFQELSKFPPEDQKHLLHKADVEAFRGWRFFVPVMVHATILSASVAIGQTLPKATKIPDSIWSTIGVAIGFMLLGVWLARCWEKRRLRPFLKSQIERAHQVA